MVFLDIEMPGMKGLDVLREIRAREKDFRGHDHGVRFCRSGSGGDEEGAYDFIPKPFKANHIALVVEKAMERQRLRREKEVLSEEVDKRYRLVAGTSAKLNAAISGAKKAAGSKSTILLLGESGTGKELFARAIHTGARERTVPSLPSIALVSQRSCWRANCSVTKKALLPVLPSSKEERSKSPMAVRYFSTKSAISPRNFRLSSCDFSRSESLSGWAAPSLFGST
jgi:hypothetical protein